MENKAEHDLHYKMVKIYLGDDRRYNQMLSSGNTIHNK